MKHARSDYRRIQDLTTVFRHEDVARLFAKMEAGGDTMPMDDAELRRFAMWQRGEG
jgi:hypothetical protein